MEKKYFLKCECGILELPTEVYNYFNTVGRKAFLTCEYCGCPMIFRHGDEQVEITKIESIPISQLVARKLNLIMQICETSETSGKATKQSLVEAFINRHFQKLTDLFSRFVYESPFFNPHAKEPGIKMAPINLIEEPEEEKRIREKAKETFKTLLEIQDEVLKEMDQEKWKKEEE